MSVQTNTPEAVHGASQAPSVDLHEFMNVDSTGDPTALISALDTGRCSPGMRAIGERMRTLLRPAEGGSLLDVGCGPGDDAREMASALPPGSLVVGVDASRAIIAAARRRSAVGPGASPRFIVGDATRLPFPDASFDRCWVQTLLQHLPHPARALQEIGRVLRPRGTAVAFEFDLGTEFVDHPDKDITRLLLDQIAEHALDAWTGRRLAGLYRNAGFMEVTVEPRVVMNDHAMFAVTTRPVLARLVRDGRLGARKALAWIAQLQELARLDGYLGGSVGFIVTARSPYLPDSTAER